MKKETHNIAVLVVGVAIVAGGGAFYAGMHYAQSQTPPPNQRGGRSSQYSAGMRGNNGNFTTGQIISKDDKSVTLKLRDGGSKIIFYSPSTVIMKSATGTPQDIATGNNVMVAGTANPDGSLNAESIQLRPNMPNQQQEKPTTPPANQ